MTKTLMAVIGLVLIGLGAVSPLVARFSDPGKVKPASASGTVEKGDQKETPSQKNTTSSTDSNKVPAAATNGTSDSKNNDSQKQSNANPSGENHNLKKTSGESPSAAKGSATGTHPVRSKVQARRIDTLTVASIALPSSVGLALLFCFLASVLGKKERFSGWVLISGITCGIVGALMFILAIERADEVSTSHAVLNLFLSSGLCFLYLGFVGLAYLGSQNGESEPGSELKPSA